MNGRHEDGVLAVDTIARTSWDDLLAFPSDLIANVQPHLARSIIEVVANEGIMVRLVANKGIGPIPMHHRVPQSMPPRSPTLLDRSVIKATMLLLVYDPDPCAVETGSLPVNPDLYALQAGQLS